MPEFPGGDTTLLKYILENTKYPEAAKANNIQGKVIVRFCITETGSIDKISVIRGVDPELDKEAMRVVSTLPAFQPGRQGGKAVPVWYMVPISFSLNGGKLPETVPPPPPPPQIEVVEETKGVEPAPFVIVEEMPQFPGGITALTQYLQENTKYPEVAKANKITGKVIVRLCITTTGSISQISVLKGVDPELDKEAMRVVSTLPPFNPGKQGGKPVPVWYMIPVNFALI
jgi:TonB family protein